MTRTIRVASTRGLQEPIETSASTLGELAPILESRGIPLSSTQIIVQGSNVELSHPSAVLPEGDFTICIFQKKSKAGYDNEEEIVEELVAIKKILLRIDARLSNYENDRENLEENSDRESESDVLISKEVLLARELEDTRFDW